MDKKTRDYLEKRVSEYDNISTRITEYEKACNNCRKKRSGEVHISINGYNYRITPEILEAFAGVLEAEIVELAKEKEAL